MRILGCSKCGSCDGVTKMSSGNNEAMDDEEMCLECLPKLWVMFSDAKAND